MNPVLNYSCICDEMCLIFHLQIPFPFSKYSIRHKFINSFLIQPNILFILNIFFRLRSFCTGKMKTFHLYSQYHPYSSHSSYIFNSNSGRRCIFSSSKSECSFFSFLLGEICLLTHTRFILTSPYLFRCQKHFFF